ncbi:MAG: carbohydrate porin [Deltaproteobacteria bacterium]|nr:carbohydrate porin [Deltaproteobacteria bacterium]
MGTSLHVEDSLGKAAGSFKAILIAVFAVALVFLNSGAWADDNLDAEAGDKAGERSEPARDKKPVGVGEVEELKARVDALEKRLADMEVVDGLGHRLHPIHSIYGLKISGGLTVTAQKADNLKEAGDRGATAVSADIVMESPVGRDGRVVAVFDFQRGAGLKNLPPFFTSPNGNPTGPNNDIESFNNDSVHVAQFYYERAITPGLVASVGQLDPTAYFDINGFANSERTQFLANGFVNNPAVEFGGSDNFYGPGFRLTYGAAGFLDITLGAFEGNGDYNDPFDSPFLMAEADFKLKPMGRDGNYRIYYWDRQGRQDLAYTANPNDAGLLKAENKGVGVSIDQKITDSFGVWLRAGVQREKVAWFNRYVGGGVNLAGVLPGRDEDAVGFGYGASLMGKDYKDYKTVADAGFEAGVEHYFELYYNISVDKGPHDRGLHISPDIQYVVNPGGDRRAENLFIYGLRLQASF